MSRVFKSHQCIEATPCQLEPMDMDAFFITQNQPSEEPENSPLFELPKALNESEDSEITENSETPGILRETAKREVEEMLQSAKHEAETILLAAERKATDTLADAKSQAEALIASGKDEVEQIKAEARQEGETEGRKSGLEQIRLECAENLSQALALVSGAECERERRILSSETELLQLAGAIAQKIIGAELALSPESQMEMVKRVLSQDTQADTYNIRMNPEDLDMWDTKLIPQLQSVFIQPKEIRLQPDSAIERGSCYIETNHGNIDGRIETQMELIMGELLKLGQLQ